MSTLTNSDLVGRVQSAGLLFLLLWTLGVHVVTFLTLPFGVLYAAFMAGVLGAAYGTLRPFSFYEGVPEVPQMRLAPGIAVGQWAMLAAIAFVIMASVGLQYLRSDFLPFWVVALGLGVAALLFGGKLSPAPILQSVPPEGSATNTAAVFLLSAVAMVAFYLFTSIPDADDSLFLNFATGAIAERDAVFARDTMLGIEGLDFIKSTYRLESYQLLAALIADASGVSVLFAAHTVLPVAMLIWVASVLVGIHAALFPRAAGAAVAIHLLVLCGIAGALQSFGYHAIPRFFHGKAPFVTAMIPMVAMLTIAAMRGSEWRPVWLLSAAIIISLGFTANALYIAPLAVLLVMVALFQFRPEDFLRGVRLAVPIIYPAGFAAFFLFVDPPSGSQFTESGTVGGTVWGVFGSPPVLILSLFFLGLCTALPMLGAQFRAVGVYILAFLVIAVNPFTWPAYGEYVTGNINYRLFWTVPFALLVAAALAALWQMQAIVTRGAVALVLALLLAGPGSILRQAEFGLASLKVPADEFALAERLAETLSPDDLLLAPEEVSQWVPVIEGAPGVVEGRAIYAPQRLDPVHAEELAVRAELFAAWAAADPGNADLPVLIEAIDLTAIMLDLARPHHAALAGPLAAEFELAWEEGDYRLMLRP